MKKFLSLILCALLVVGALAGCNTQTGTDNNTGSATPITKGSLLLNVNACVSVTYDADALVLAVEGVDENGTALVADYKDFYGKSCIAVIGELIAAAAKDGYLTADTKNALVKQNVGSVSPNTSFLENLLQDTQTALQAVSSAKLTLIAASDLDAEGYIGSNTAQKLLLNHLSAEEFSFIDGESHPLEGVYTFSVAADEIEGVYAIDAANGNITEGAMEEEIDHIGDTEDLPTDIEVEIDFGDTLEEDSAANQEVDE